MLYRLDPHRPTAFPNPELAEADGLLAMGGDLSPQRLLAAYSLGIFPWYNDDTPPLWWCPDPRCVILPETFRLPRTARRELQAARYTINIDQDFRGVINACAMTARRVGEGEWSKATWLGEDMRSAYCRLHELGFAHSVEAWDEEGLAGGLYGLALGRAFFGESMFHVRPGASKAALAAFLPWLWDQGCTLVDCQMETPHILRYGAQSIPRKAFLHRLAEALAQEDTSLSPVEIFPQS